MSESHQRQPGVSGVRACDPAIRSRRLGHITVFVMSAAARAGISRPKCLFAAESGRLDAPYADAWPSLFNSDITSSIENTSIL